LVLDLDPIKARLAAATPERWHWNPIVTMRTDEGDVYLIVAYAGDQPDPTYIGNVDRPDDAALVANAPADLAALVAEVERLRSAIWRHKEKYQMAWDEGYTEVDEELWEALDA
jgi:hypothetical protein